MVLKLLPFLSLVRVVEPLIIFSTAYSAFLSAELFHWSGIVSIIAFGITSKRFAFQNISQKSYTTVKCATKTMAATSDCIIFLFLGLVLIEEEHYYHEVGRDDRDKTVFVTFATFVVNKSTICRF